MNRAAAINNMRYLYLLVGIPGSGKSTWIRDHAGDDDEIISRDSIRFHLLKDEDEYFDRESEVFDKFIKYIQNALYGSFWDIYVDATHLNEKARNKVLDRLDIPDNVKIIPVYFEICPEEALRRNSQRTGRARVPDNVILNMYASLIPPTMNEKHKYKEIWRIQT